MTNDIIKDILHLSGELLRNSDDVIRVSREIRGGSLSLESQSSSDSSPWEFKMGSTGLLDPKLNSQGREYVISGAKCVTYIMNQNTAEISEPEGQRK